MKWILIFALVTDQYQKSPVTSVAVEFNSKEACMSAASLAARNARGIVALNICAAKG
jgi:hypothetical protein